MKFVIANWKMNGNISLANEFVTKIDSADKNCTVIVCPPTPLLSYFKDFKYFLGAQNCFFEKKGAFTGEVSPQLLKEIGCKYVILGHSERRAIFKESDELVLKKWEAAIREELTPIVCIGEKAEERDNWKDVLATQLSNYCRKKDYSSTPSSSVQTSSDPSSAAEASLSPSLPTSSTFSSSPFAALSSNDLCGTIFAYEPVWSIGTGKVPAPEDISEVVSFIRGILGEATNYYVVYGGSVAGKNAAEILSIDGIDGVLVGSASLKAEEFNAIIEAVPLK